jgi:metal-sulfur cluster biosynthetic enzyme
VKIPVLATADPRETAPAYTQSYVSGGRDLWSQPRLTSPEDPVAAVWHALGEVLDPEIPISLTELGLIYGVEFRDAVVRIELTFTATACPCMDFIREDLRDRLLQESWIDGVEIHEVWSPPWTNDRITQEGRDKLRSLGIGVG